MARQSAATGWRLRCLWVRRSMARDPIASISAPAASTAPTHGGARRVLRRRPWTGAGRCVQKPPAARPATPLLLASRPASAAPTENRGAENRGAENREAQDRDGRGADDERDAVVTDDGPPWRAMEPVDPWGPCPGDNGNVARSAIRGGLAAVLRDSPPQILDVSRATRVVPPALRRALTVRDGGCRFPGCDRPAVWTDAHHIWSWATGGPTALDNLILLCRAHHRAVHEGGWTIITGGPGGRVNFQPPHRDEPRPPPVRPAVA